MSTFVRVLAVVAGAALFGATVHAILANMLVPRPRQALIGKVATAPTRDAFRWLAFRRPSYVSRDALLAASGPVTVLVQLVVFVISFVVAAALLVYGFTGGGVTHSVYEAGSSLLTLGIVEPANTGTIAVGLITAFVGLVVVAILIGYLMTLYSAYSQRESAVAQLGLLAGEPAWGPELLCRSTLLGNTDRSQLYDSWTDWISDVRLSHVLYPILNQFRSSQPRRHWLATLIAVLDAAALEFTTLEPTSNRTALVRVLAEGTETLSSLRAATRPVAATPNEGPSDGSPDPAARWLLSGSSAAESAVLAAISADSQASLIGPNAAEAARRVDDPGITRDQWSYACELLSAAGMNLQPDSEAAWQAFRAIRASYANNAYAMAQEVYAAPAPWSGPRRPDTPVMWPTLASKEFRAVQSDGRGDDASPTT